MTANCAIEKYQSAPATGRAGSMPSLPALGEDTLIALAKRGDAAAFDHLWQSHAQMILRITYRITKNREDAEDALQDSLLMAFMHIKKFDGRSTFSTWLTRIAFNSALMMIRKKRHGVDLSLDDRRNQDVTLDILSPASDPEACVAQREQEEILRDAIRSLRPGIRQAVELQQLQEHSLRETAKRLGVSLAAAKSLLFHAKIALRKFMKPETKDLNRAAGASRLSTAA